MEKKPHKHAEVIRAWADGAKIEYRQPDTGKWLLCYDTPAFMADYEYRVKPVRAYPEIALQDEQLCTMFEYKYPLKFESALRKFANGSIRHAIDSGQVVTREEFSRAIGDRAARDMAIGQAVREKAYTIAASHAMRTGVLEDIARIDLGRLIEQIPNG